MIARLDTSLVRSLTRDQKWSHAFLLQFGLLIYKSTGLLTVYDVSSVSPRWTMSPFHGASRSKISSDWLFWRDDSPAGMTLTDLLVGRAFTADCPVMREDKIVNVTVVGEATQMGDMVEYYNIDIVFDGKQIGSDYGHVKTRVTLAELQELDW